MKEINKVLTSILEARLEHGIRKLRRNISNDLYWEIDNELANELRQELIWNLRDELNTQLT
jgi:hypothetical protein